MIRLGKEEKKRVIKTRSTETFTYFVELDDVRVANLLQNFNLPRNSLNVLLVVDLFFLKDFDGNLK